MSSRFPPVHESRYPPRTRSRSPPRYQEWRSSGPSNPGFNSNNNNRHNDFGRGLDPPRGPKTFNDPPRGPPPGPGSGPPAPIGPRGRGAPPRNEFRELRDAPPLGTDRSFRDRDFDRRPRPTSPRPRSPVRGFRDGPVPPRDLDLGRGRRDSRDGPINAGPNYSDQPPFGQSSFGRGGFNGRGRGRGRGDFGFRDRRGPPDERNTFRPRDRSPPTRWGSVSRTDRDDWRPERREDDRWTDRDDREADRFRRDAVSSRFDSRPPTPHQQTPLAQAVADRPPPFESSRDDLPMRRPSTTSLSGAKEPLRRDVQAQAQPIPVPLPPNDLLAGRVESSAARYGSRASSPPPSAPQVPAFGSLSFKPQPYTGPTSNVWKASPESRAPATPATPAKPQEPSPPVVKTIPTAPKAQLAVPPPAAPRAPRALENAAPVAPREPTLDRAPSAPKPRNSSAPQPPVPTGPWALRTDERSGAQFAPAAARDGRSLSGSFQPDVISTPTSPRTSGPPIAQMTPMKPLETMSNQIPTPQMQHTPSNTQDGRGSRADMAPPRLGTPPPTAPSGPRNIHTFSTSPVMQNPNIPTAPKAIRGPPMAPRASVDRGQPSHRPLDRNGPASTRALLGAPRAPAWNQWIRPGAPQYRDPAVPAKRDANGEEKAQQLVSRTSPQGMHRHISDPSSTRVDESRDDRASKTAPASPDRRMSAANMPIPEEQTAFREENSVPRQPEHIQSDLMVDADIATAESSEEDISDEEGMDLDEEDFAQSKAKFERQKAHLEAQMIDLSAREYRATTPLEQITKLSKITVEDLPTNQALISPKGKGDVMESLEKAAVPAAILSPTGLASLKTRNDCEPDLLTPKKEQIEEAEEVVASPIQPTFKRNEIESALETAEVVRGEDIDMDGSDDLDFITPEPKRSVETIALPYLTKAPLTPLSDLGAYHDNIARQNAAKPALILHYQAQTEEQKMLQKDLSEQYLEKYRAWRLETQLLDRERASKESEERQMSVELGLDIESSPVLENPVSESRSRLHKFSSEYDIQQVLKQSEETARLEQEKVERESRRAQIDLEKEAIPPDVWDDAAKEKNMFRNMNRYRDPICLTEIYGYEPEFDTFTEAEHKRFVELFKERPKQWGEIAAQLPGRTYVECIHHYYKYKWDGRFKERTKRKTKAGGRRGGKTGARARAAPLMADLSKGEEDSSSGPMLTETGRPRRAATRTAYTAEKDPEVKATPVAAATTTKKVLASGDTATEKPAKRRKTTAAGEKPQKRGRQTAVSTTASITSPAGNDKDVVLSKEDLARAQTLEDASLLASMATGQRIIPSAQPIEYAHETLATHASNEATERARAPVQTSIQRSSASSYWSVPEQTDFVKFIAHFGTDFGAIANHMGTKTQTMVKNYYQRLVESGNRPDVVEAANVANARRDRGEDMGVPPTPTPINKRRYDNPGPALPRTASSSQGEVMDIDPVPPTQPATISQPSSQFQHQYRFSMAPQPTSAPPQRAAPSPLQPHQSPALSKPSISAQPRGSISSSGPKMGFFSESRMERRPTLQSSDRPAQQPSPSLMHQQQPTPPGLMHQNLSHLTSEFVKNLKEEQERALSIQKRASQEHVPEVVQHPMFQPLAAQTSAPSGSPQLSMLDRPLERDERSNTPGLSSLGHSRAGPAMFRSILGSPGPMPSSAGTMHPPFRSAQIPSPPKREEQLYRPGSVPAPSPAPSIAKPATSLTTGPPAEPRKTSNLASLLNSEPEEPRQKKRVSDQGVPQFTQSPTPSTLSVAPSGPNTSIFPPRREVFNQTPSSRQEFEARPVYSQPISHAATPSVQHEIMPGRSGTPVGSRQTEWQSRQPIGQNLTSSSPHPPAPLERDVRPYFSHRASLAGLTPQSRANPSPPPSTHPYLNHSRTPSIGGRPLTPSQLQSQGASSLSHMTQAQTSQAQPQAMQPNPYGGPSHVQQMQNQQNQYSHRHNSSGGSSQGGLHQRQPSRGEEMAMLRQQQQQQQERDYHMSREREHRMEVDRQYKEREAQFHQAQQEQQRYAQHRTPQPFQPQPPLSGPPQMLSLREQARIEADQSYRDAREREQRYEQEMHMRRLQQDEEERMRYDYRNSNGMIGRSSAGGYGGFPPPPHRR